MDIERHVQAIQSDLAAAAALGDEASAVAGERLAAAVESSLQLRLLDVLTEATLALNGQLTSGHVEVRLAGRDPELVLVEDRAGEAEAPPAPGDDLSARITLRLPEALKVQIEAVASARASRPTRGSSGRSRAPSSRAPAGRAAETDFRASPRARKRGAPSWPFTHHCSAASIFPISTSRARRATAPTASASSGVRQARPQARS